MAIGRQGVAGGQGGLGEHVGRARHDGGEAHDLGDPDYARMPQQTLHRVELEVGARGLERGARHAARHGDVDVKCELFGGVEQPAHALLAGDVGDLVRVAHHARDAAGQHRVGVLLGRHQRRLEVHVSVYQPGCEMGSSEVDHLVGVSTEVGADRCDKSPGDQHVGCQDLVAEDVDDAAAAQQQAAASASGRHRDGLANLCLCRSGHLAPVVQGAFNLSRYSSLVVGALAGQRRRGLAGGFRVERVLTGIVIGRVFDGRYLGPLLAADAVDTLLEGHVGRAAALATATEADVGNAVLDAVERDVATVAGDAGVDVAVEGILYLLLHLVVPFRALEEHPEARLHNALDEVDYRAVQLLGTHRIEVGLEGALVLNLVVGLLVRRLHQPQPLFGLGARDAQGADALPGL